MADEAKPELSEETLAMAAAGRGEVSSEVVDGDGAGGSDADGTDAPPEWLPAKFVKDGKPDYEALAKSYAELEKLRGKPQEQADDNDGSGGDPDGDPGAGDDPGSDDGADVASGIPAELFGTAEAEWAEKGELTAETREKIIASGVPEETLNTYLAGVAALSAALTASVYEAAGGEEAYTAAVAWARENWTAGQVEKFDAALNDGDLMPVMVKALMADYGAANPGEGELTRGGNGGSGDSDLYHDPEEFTRDLTEATLKNDALARKKAVQKLERSKKAGTLKHVTPRSGVSQLLG